VSKGFFLYFRYVFMVIIKLIEGTLVFFNKYKYYFKNWLTRAHFRLWNVSALFRRRVRRPNGGLWDNVQIVSETSHHRTTCMTYWPPTTTLSSFTDGLIPSVTAMKSVGENNTDGSSPSVNQSSVNPISVANSVTNKKTIHRRKHRR